VGHPRAAPHHDSNRRHVGELVAGSAAGSASTILASRVTRLVAVGLLSRAARRDQRAAHSLTEAGIQVLLVLVALGTWGVAHRDGEHRLRIRAALLRDGGPALVAARMDELRERHLGPRSDADAPRPSEHLRAACGAAMGDGTGSMAAGDRP
jgi:hypothetical protein